MKKQLRFFFVLLFIVLFAYLLRPSSEHLEKLVVVRGITLAGHYKNAVAGFYSKNKSLPAGDEARKLVENNPVDLAETAVDRISIGDEGPGSIVIYYTTSKLADVPAAINDTKITLQPQVFGDGITWSCSGTVPEEYLPNACQ